MQAMRLLNSIFYKRNSDISKLFWKGKLHDFSRVLVAIVVYTALTKRNRILLSPKDKERNRKEKKEVEEKTEINSSFTIIFPQLSFLIFHRISIFCHDTDQGPII